MHRSIPHKQGNNILHMYTGPKRSDFCSPCVMDTGESRGRKTESSAAKQAGSQNLRWFSTECSTYVKLQPMSYRSRHGCCISPERTLAQVPVTLKSLSPSPHRGDSWHWVMLCLGRAPNPLPFVPPHPLPVSPAAAQWQVTPQMGMFWWKVVLVLWWGWGQWAMELCWECSGEKRRDPINARGWDKVNINDECWSLERLSTGPE